MRLRPWLVAVAPFALLLATGCGGCNPGLQKELEHADGTGGVARFSVAFSPDGTMLLTTGAGQVKLWDVAGGKVIGTLGVKGQNPYAVFAGTGRIVTTDDQTVTLWDTDAVKRANEQGGGPAETGLRSLKTETTLSRLSVSQDGTRALAESDVGALVFDLGDAGPIKVLGEYRHPEKQMAEYLLHPDGQTFFVGHKSGKVEQRSVEGMGTNGPPTVVLDNSATVTGLAIDRDGGKLAVALADKSVKVWAAMSGTPGFEPVGNPITHSEEVSSLALSGDGKLVVTATTAPSTAGIPDKSVVRLWDADSGDQVGGRYSLGWCRSVAVAPDGKSFATVEASGKVKLWKVPER